MNPSTGVEPIHDAAQAADYGQPHMCREGQASIVSAQEPSRLAAHRVAGRCANTPGRGRHSEGSAAVAKRTCSVGECARPAKSRGMCNAHYARWKRHGDPTAGRVLNDPQDYCHVEGCEKANGIRRGMCEMHYRRWCRHGTPEPPAKPAPPRESYFWPKVDVGHPLGCWEWTGFINEAGYGRFSLGNRKGGVPAHRFAFEQLRGPIPCGLVLDHLCRNRACVNPDHLEPVEFTENVRRGWVPNKKHCVHGHPLAGDNLYRRPDNGGRQCRACRRIRAGYAP